MELEIIKIIAGAGGIGGVFAIVILYIYRKDRQSSENRQREDRRFMEDRLTEIIEKDQFTRENNTKALTELVTLLTRLNGRIK